MTDVTSERSRFDADEQGWFGEPGLFGGRFMPEALVAALDAKQIAAAPPSA